MTARPQSSVSKDERRPTTRHERRSGSSSPISASRPSRATTASMSSCVRSRARSRCARVEMRLVARNNEVLADESDGCERPRRLRSRPRARRGRAGARSSSVATLGTDYGFLDLGLSAFDLTDRGVKGRAGERRRSMPICTPSAASTGRARRCSRPRCCARRKGTAIARCALTLVVRRPDGVEYRRAMVEDQGLGGRALALPILPGAAARHLADRGLHGPEGAVGRRNELSRRGLRARAARTDAHAEDGGAASRRAGADRPFRPLSLRRARRPSRRDRRGRRRRGGDEAASRGSRDSRSASTTRGSRSSAEIEEDAHHRRPGPRHASGPGSRRRGSPPDRGAHRAPRRRGRRPGHRAQRDPADPAEGAGDRRAQELRVGPRRGRHCQLRRRPRARPTARASSARAWPGRLPDRTALPMVQCRRALGVRARALDTPRRRRAHRPDRAAPRASPFRCNGAPTASRCALPTSARRRRRASTFTVGWSGDQSAETPGSSRSRPRQRRVIAPASSMQTCACRRASPARRRSPS